MSANTDTLFRFTVDVPSLLPTANHRLSHWGRAALTRQTRYVAAMQARRDRCAAGISENTDEPRTLRLVLLRGKGQRLLDADAIYAALKPVVDALVEAGWLADDRPEMLPDYRAEQRIDRTRGPAVEVTVGMVSE